MQDFKVAYENVDDDHIRHCFEKAFSKYSELHPRHVVLTYKIVKGSTMKAQPIINLRTLFSKEKQYRVTLAHTVRDTDDIIVSELPEDVLIGWFAHELGHVIEYLPFSNFQMIIYGLRYLISSNFRKEVEYAADLVALDHGFHAEIMATKRFILEHDLLEENYKQKIRRYYMPIEDVEKYLLENVPIHETGAAEES